MKRFLIVATVICMVASFFINTTVEAVNTFFSPELLMGKYAPGEEVIEMRTENGATKWLGGRKYALNTFLAPIHYKDNYTDPNEQWKAIDLTFINGKITKAPYELTLSNNTVTIKDKKTGAITVISLSEINGKTVFTNSYSYSKGKAICPNVATDTDLQIEAGNSVIKFTRILKSSSAPLTAKFNIAQTGNSIKLDYKASDAQKDIPVISSLSNGVLTETIDNSKITINYPLSIDPTLNVLVSAGTDDAYVTKLSGTWTIYTAANLYVGYFDATQPYNGFGMRFNSITVPNGATIDASTCNLTANGAAALDNVNAKIYGNDTDNATTFSTIANFQERRGTDCGGASNDNITTASVSWNAIAHWTGDVTYQTPEIKTIVQEIVNRTGWVSGNSMVIFVDDYTGLSTATNGTDRKAYAYDVSSVLCPGIHIEYTVATNPTVVTDNSSNIYPTSALCSAEITNLNGGGNVTYKGIQYDTDSGAPYANVVSENGTWGISSFSENLTSLSKGTKYYFRGVAENPGGSGYGAEMSFLTLPDGPSGFTATAGDNQTALAWTVGTGADNTTIRYRTDGVYPTTYADGSSAYNGTGNSYTHTGLNNGTTYYYAMWSIAIDGALTQYSTDNACASATPVAVPTVTTTAAASIAETTAVLGGNITDLRGAGNCSSRGVEYDVDSGAPYANESHEDGVFGVGAFTRNIATLSKGTKYYFRAYATNVNGNGYGTELTFLTLPDPPNTFTATAVSETQINLAWVKGTGADNTTIRAKLGSYPTDITDGTGIYNDTGTAYFHVGLTSGQHWYYRAWSIAIDGALTQTSSTYAEANATTFVAPTVVTGICSGNSNTWAVLNGNVTSVGTPAADTIHGFDYGLTTAYGSVAITTSSTSYPAGPYYGLLTGLSPSTIYHYRAKVYNGIWGYGADAIFSTKGSPAIEYYYNTTSDNGTKIYGVNWASQTFTTDNTTERSVTSIRLLLYRVGNPGYVYASIRNTAGGIPTGIDLTSGILNGNGFGTAQNWYEFTVATEKSLELSTQYAIVVNAPSGDSSNYIYWRLINAGGITGGNGLTSQNSGVSWVSYTNDYNYEIWGNQTLEIQDVKVFQSYRATGDWLIACRYINIFAPYYPNDDIKKYFSLQLINSTDNVTASNSIAEWGNRVGSIYLSAAQVATLEWNGAYRVRIQGTFSPYPYTEYALQSSDWLGDDLSQLDSWAFSSATVIAAHDSTVAVPVTLTANIAARGTVLNATGGDIMIAGIPGLSTVRPGIFQIYTTSNSYTPVTQGQSYRTTTRLWEMAVGPDAVIAFNRLGVNLGGLTGDQVIAILGFVLAVIIAATSFPFGHTTAANIFVLIILFAFVFFGIDIIWIVMLYLVAAFLLVKKLWIDTGI